ncbi:MAG: glycosyltransferase [Candidatus Methanoperedens sp.]|nr:glycosyltransferase [Candidatus Methanoperedens sp.]
MKILQVISSFPPAYAYGGPTRVTYDISRELVKKGHEVTVYTTDVFNARSRFKYETNPMKIDGIEVYHFNNISNRLAHKNLAMAPIMAFELNRTIKNFDVIHLHEYRSFQAILVHYYSKKYNIPYILQPHGTIPIISKTKQKKSFDLLFGHSIVKDTSKIIATSRIESNQYCTVFPELDKEKVIHIPNGISMETYQNLPKKGQFKKKYSIKTDEKIILFMSRVHERKGADILVEAFSKLKNDFEKVKLVIAGPDEGYLQKLKQIVNKLWINDDVIFTGTLLEPDKFMAYVDADVFVLPSKDKYESFGNVVLEACACGKPVVVTNNCGVSEWIGEDVGYTIECDKDQLKDAILKVLIDDRLMRKFGEEGRKLVENNFDLKIIITYYEKIYEGIKHPNERKETTQ